MDALRFDTHARDKRVRSGNIKINNYEKGDLLGALLPSGWDGSNNQEFTTRTTNRAQRPVFPTEILDEFYERIRLIIQEKHAADDTGRFDDEIVVRNDKILEYIFSTSTQHKKYYVILIFYKL